MPEGAGLILASASRARREMLENAGLNLSVVPADVDEPAIRRALRAQSTTLDPGDMAEVLARAKAEAVSELHREALVIGSDQIVACGGETFSKPRNLADARASLEKLRGRTHQLYSAVALASNGAVTWSAVDRADMTMRAFSGAFLSRYLEQAGGDKVWPAGAYMLEGLGVQLFENIDGDYFTILGLPLLPLLDQLRRQGAIVS